MSNVLDKDGNLVADPGEAEPCEHAPGPWYVPAWNALRVVMKERGHEYIQAIVAPTGRTKAGHSEGRANAKLTALAPTAPHKCPDPQCPGNVNRRKLELYGELLAFIKPLASELSDGVTLSRSWELSERVGAALARAEEIEP